MARVFITGSSDGLGLMAARLLISQGDEVLLHGRNEGRSRDALAAAVGGASLLIPGLPGFASAALAGVLFIGVGQLIGMLPQELHDALGPHGLLASRGRT